MIRTLFVALVSLAAASHAHAAILAVPGIPSFNTSLGTLTKATVTIDPPPTTTTTHSSNFNDVDNHVHNALLAPITISGLGTFNFALTPTSVESNPPFGSHSHEIDVPPSTQMFTGSGLNWFLNPANGVNSVFFLNSGMFTVEDHTHNFQPAPTQPMTTFEFTPATIPEPTAALLASLAMVAVAARRRV